LDEWADIFRRYKERINRELMNAAPDIEPRSLYEPIRYFLGIGGKRLRPILLILSTKAVGGDTDQAIDAAVAIELLHNFTLVHDDIMDHDHLRRGHPTVHVRWDESVAILAGDGLIGLAYRHLMKLPAEHLIRVCRIFTEGVIEVCEGQAFDKEFELRDEVTPGDYFKMIGKKTGRLITMATQIGAILGGGSEKEVQILKEYGSIIGIAFQIQDDLLDIMASEDVIGKTFGSDVMAGKKTYMMVKSLELVASHQKDRGVDVLKASKVTPEMLLEMRGIFEETGILDQAQEEIQSAFDKANRILGAFPHPERTAGLRRFSEMLLKRKY
jgi:geranylgeranyl diphosphate synthase type II